MSEATPAEQAGYEAVYDIIQALPANPHDPSYNDAVRNGYIWRGVEAFLNAYRAQVQPEPVALDYEKARDAVLTQLEDTIGWVDREEIDWLRANPDDAIGEVNIDTYFDFGALLDALAACVRPAPPQAIDRDALLDVLIRYDVEHPATLGDAADIRSIYVDRILALLRPVKGGVVLTREEAAVALKWHAAAGSAMREDYELVTRLTSTGG